MADESPLAARWKRAAQDLGFMIALDTTIALPSGAQLTVPVQVPDFGAPRGMLVVSDYSLISRHSDELAKEGFGYSVLSAGGGASGYDRESFVDMLSDWGWSGEPSKRPPWLIEGTSESRSGT